MALLGIDVGTTMCKCLAFSERGEVLAQAGVEYGVVRSREGDFVDANVIFQNVLLVLKQVLSELREPATALAVSSFGETFVQVDERGEVVGLSYLYSDKRGEQYAAELERKLGAKYVIDHAGVAPHSMYSAPKILYVAREQPERFARTARFLQISDFVGFKLTGECCIDYALAARSMMFDVRRKCFDAGILDAVGIGPERLSRPYPAGTAFGKFRPEIKAELGIDYDVVVSTGGHDQVCAAIGAGVLNPGESVLGMGTVECVTPVFSEPVTDPEMQNAGYACVPYLTDKYTTYAFNYTGGGAVKWFKDTVLRYEGKDFYQKYDAAAAQAPSGALFLPYLAGVATPYMDNDVRGAFLNLSLTTDAACLYRAVMEGVCFETRLNLDLLAARGVRVDRLTATGGGARSDVWLRIKADILERPVARLSNTEAGTAGAAMLAGVASGVYSDLGEAAGQFVRISETFEPDGQSAARYEPLYQRYRKLYAAVKAVMQ